MKPIQHQQVFNDASDGISLIENLIRSKNSNYYSFVRWDMSNKYLLQWAKNGIIHKHLKRSAFPLCNDTEICILDKESDLILAKGLLEYYIERQPFENKV